MREDTRCATLGEAKRIKCVRSREEERFKKKGVVNAVRGQVKKGLVWSLNLALNGSFDDCY